MKDQVERSSSSVSDNIAEGHTSYYYKDKIKCMMIARKEAGETQNHIRSFGSKNYLSNNRSVELVREIEEIIRGINGYVWWVRGKAGFKQ